MEELKHTIKNGNLIVHNVPYFIHNQGKAYSGHSSYKLAYIFQHMIKNHLTEYNFEEHDNI